MPSHFSALGFEPQTQEDLLRLAQEVAKLAQVIPVTGGQYLRWAGGSGEELWLQIDSDGDLIGLNPHFSGTSLIRVGLQARVRRDADTALDGAFRSWANPTENKPDTGDYPFVFDVPDAAAYSDLQLPSVATAQIAAFAHEVTFHESPDAFSASQRGQEVQFASRSFIPSGLFTPGEGATEPPEATAIFTGHVLEGGIRKNAITGKSFYWALVDTLGGRYDAVVDESLLAGPPSAGGVLSGAFWLSGRLSSPTKARRGLARFWKRA